VSPVSSVVASFSGGKRNDTPVRLPVRRSAKRSSQPVNRVARARVWPRPQRRGPPASPRRLRTERLLHQFAVSDYGHTRPRVLQQRRDSQQRLADADWM